MKISNELDEEQLEQIVKMEQLIFSNALYKKEQLLEMKENSNYNFIVAIEKEKIFGYIIAHNSYDVIEIMKIAVLEEKCGKNLAEQLWKKLLEITELNIILEVRESNLRAIKFYKKMGMKKISLRKGYYSDNGENAVIMFLERK